MGLDHRTQLAHGLYENSIKVLGPSEFFCLVT